MSKLDPMRDEDQPRINRFYSPRRGNFPVPGAQSTEAPTYCLRINVHWVGHLQGLLMLLDQADAWTGNTGQIEFARNEARKLIASMEICGDDNIDMGTLENCVMPVGTILLNATVPEGWMQCDGRHLSAADYPDLYGAWAGSTYVGLIIDPASPYYLQNGIILPDLRARVPVGNTDTDPLSEFHKADLAAGLSSRDVGQSGGAETHTLTAAQIPAHTHPLPTNILRRFDNGTNPRTLPAAGTQVDYNVAHSTQANTGGGGSHNNMQPFHVLRYIVKVEECEPEPGVTMSYITRQNPENPCQYEYSIDGGTTWILSFDFNLCFGQMKSEVSQILDIVSQIEGGTNTTIYNDYTTYIDNLVNQYDGDVTNVYPEAEYGDEDDFNRDAALCFAIEMYVLYLKELIKELLPDDTELPETILTWMSAALGAASATLGLGILIGTVTFVTAPLVAAGLAVFSGLAGLGALVQSLRDADVTPEDIDNFDMSAFTCCVYDAMKGQTISEALFQNAFTDCASSSLGTSEIDDIMSEMLLTIAQGKDVFVGFLKILSMSFDTAKNGISLPCDCDDDICEYQDFRESMGSWTPAVDDTWIPGEGFRGEPAPVYSAARCFRDLGALFEITRIDMTWYCPRVDDAQFYEIAVSTNGTDYTQLRREDFQPIGAQTDSWTGSTVARYIRLTAAGSMVNSRAGQIMAANVCYE